MLDHGKPQLRGPKSVTMQLFYILNGRHQASSPGQTRDLEAFWRLYTDFVMAGNPQSDDLKAWAQRLQRYRDAHPDDPFPDIVKDLGESVLWWPLPSEQPVLPADQPLLGNLIPVPTPLQMGQHVPPTDDDDLPEIDFTGVASPLAAVVNRDAELAEQRSACRDNLPAAFGDMLQTCGTPVSHASFPTVSEATLGPSSSSMLALEPADLADISERLPSLSPEPAQPVNSCPNRIASTHSAKRSWRDAQQAGYGTNMVIAASPVLSSQVILLSTVCKHTQQCAWTQAPDTQQNLVHACGYMGKATLHGESL